MRRAVVSARVVEQIFLVVVLCRREVTGGKRLDFGHDACAVGVKVPFLHSISDMARSSILLGTVGIQTRAILRANIRALAIHLGRVVRAVEELDELSVRSLCRVE